MSGIAAKQQEVIQDFQFFDEWMDKYEHLIELGKDLSPLSEDLKTEDRLIKGCQSRVWLQAELDGEVVRYYADSDALIAKGVIALLVKVFSGETPKDIAKADTSFIDAIGLKEHLSPTRANGLQQMLKQMKLYALAFQAKNQSE
jgi:cysteine desulfuration protein SufE